MGASLVDFTRVRSTERKYFLETAILVNSVERAFAPMVPLNRPNLLWSASTGNNFVPNSKMSRTNDEDAGKKGTEQRSSIFVTQPVPKLEWGLVRKRMDYRKEKNRN